MIASLDMVSLPSCPLWDRRRLEQAGVAAVKHPGSSSVAVLPSSGIDDGVPPPGAARGARRERAQAAAGRCQAAKRARLAPASSRADGFTRAARRAAVGGTAGERAQDGPRLHLPPATGVAGGRDREAGGRLR